MKARLILTFVFVGLLSTGFSQVNNSNPEIFGKNLFEAIKTGSLEKMTSLQMSSKDAESLINEIIRVGDGQESERDKMKASFIDLKKDFLSLSSQSLKIINEMAQMDGVILSKAEYWKTEFEIEGKGNFASGKEFRIYFRYSDIPYSIKIKKTFFINNTWFLGYISEFNGTELEYK